MPEPLDDLTIARIAATRAAHGLTTDFVDLSALRKANVPMVKARSRVCAYCDATFVPTNAVQKYCDAECREAAWSSPGLAPRECTCCGAQYKPLTANQAYCSADCRREVGKERQREERAQWQAEKQDIRLLALAPAKRIQQIVASTWRTPVEDMRSPCRRRIVTWPRFAAMAIVKELLGWSTTTIGRVFGNRDHTSAMHGVRRCAELRAEHENYARLYAEAEAKCRAALEKP